MNRRLLRQSAFKFIFSFCFNNDDIDEKLENLSEDYDIFFTQEDDTDQTNLSKLNSKDRDFLNILIKGTIENLESIDEIIRKSLISWTMERIAKVDLSILRMAIFEILYYKDTPENIVINEAVELAKTFGGDDSSSFVNGVLGRVVRERVKTGE
ncbi:transcription antitermination factor NusB [Lutispora thermophila]|uniref:Transcription antitermination protein NusB n=1 Tax=Lutispora thermophila DSM 19022 TaxID=1122184 RepID=A0A1M6F5E4_9FIRM|nr:transcription antitermination factor NusB [Lutispora thermophila]SHI92901.1 NusB antitermination factor [Lutispora thermophila DSM 19022]